MSKNIGSLHKSTQSPANNGKPNLAGTAQAAPPQSKYQEMQNEEIEVLRSIYADEFEDVESKRAWSKATETTFKIKLVSYSDKDVWIYLIVTFTTTYPATAPILKVGEMKNVRPHVLESIRKVISSKPKELIGEVMIYEISTAVQDELEQAASVKAKGDKAPSLEEERAVREAAAIEQAREQQEETRRRDAEQQVLADQEIQRKFDEQARKREDARQKSSSENPEAFRNASAELATVTFDQIIDITNESGVQQTFCSVSLLTQLGRGKTTEVYSALPVVDIKNPGIVVLKRATIAPVRSKDSILQSEQLLEKLKRLRHANIISILDFKIENKHDCWAFEILMEYASQGSLKDLLNVVEHIPVQRARRIGIELLQALDFYHRNGIAHGSIHCGNVLLNASTSGSVTVKLADAGFQIALHAMVSESNHLPDASSKSAWAAPELSASTATEISKKSDIWDFGTTLVEMVLGRAVVRKYATPATFMNSMALSEPFEDTLRSLFRTDPKKRPNAFEVIPYEFFRVDVPLLASETSFGSRSGSGLVGMTGSTPSRIRHESSTMPALKLDPASRYVKEWDELGRLGKGGFGEVVKARNKLDGRIYAIKKIVQKTPAELSQVLSEVHLLATLNHPYVVRYYGAWPEDEAPSEEDMSEYSNSTENFNYRLTESKHSLGFGKSTGGLDFISSSGFPRIEFGYDDDDDEADDDEDEDAITDGEDDSNDNNLLAARKISHGTGTGTGTGSNLYLARTRSGSRPTVKSTLFIQMEFCERLTLRDIIRKGVQDNIEETWRLFRQILEGLVHVHSHGIIHRDLKPENIFIDATSNVRIGDFGLAKSGQFSISEQDGASRATEGDMTQNVGTTFYVAPELQTNTKGMYTDKIDMYSLGIIFFEMCYFLKTAMERGEVLGSIRKKEYSLPTYFNNPDRAVQGEVIDSLLKHRPSERPSSTELLRSGKVPLQIEDETIKIAIEGLSDDSSPYYHRMMSALFSKSTGRQIRAQMWDMSGKDVASSPNTDFALLQSMIYETIVVCFRRHGAVESRRQGLLPRSDYYENKNFVQLLDSSGTLVQLPYDFTLPHARTIAKGIYVAEKTYAVGMVYRDSPTGGPPVGSREADFDIFTNNKKDPALRESEVIKVVDELLDEFPPLASASMCFHVSHSDLLEYILEYCRVPQAKRAAVKEILGRLNIHSWTWQKIRSELRSASIGISATSVDELAQFDFRDTPERCLTRLQNLFGGANFMNRVHEIFMHVNDLFEYCKRWGIRRPVYFSPLSSFNEKFYQGGVMFQCLFDGKKRDIVAAGGRYDRLIKDLQPRTIAGVNGRNASCVGVNIAWDRLITSMMRHHKSSGGGAAFLKRPEESPAHGGWAVRRCDALVACFDSAILRSTGIRLVSWLWSQDISAELAIDSGSTEALLAHYSEDRHSWIVLIKPEATANTKADLKIKSLEKKEDFDVRSSDLVSFLQGQIRERDQREGASEQRHAPKHHHASHSESRYGSGKSQVQVLVAAHKSKKSNKFRAVEAAQAASQELLRSFGDGPVASIETRDEVMDMIRETRLSDAESWRRVIQKVPLNEANYIQEVQQLLQEYRSECLAESGAGSSFVFNFRTGKCIFYDLLA